MRKKIVFLCLCSLLLLNAFAQKKKYKTVVLFNQFVVKDGLSEEDIQNKYLSPQAGVVLKKIKLPEFGNKTNVKIRVTLESLGCKWNRYFSCFVLTKGSSLHTVNYDKQQPDLPTYPMANAKYPGIILDSSYLPALELMRAVTPFGVGFYNETMQNRKPVYISKWEKQVHWEQDISDLQSLLEGDTWLGLKIDNPDEGGFKVTVDLVFNETGQSKQDHLIIPIINTTPYFESQKPSDVFAHQEVEAVVGIPRLLKNIKLKYLASGHGAKQESEEFTKRTHSIDVNGREIYRDTLWREDCSDYRRFNPHAGVWTEHTKIKDKPYSETMSSSDCPRSNWCPGAVVSPVEIPLLPLPIGANAFRFSILNAGKYTEAMPNIWLVSAYLIGEY